MRVVAGEYKGRRIACPKGSAIRPTTDRVKEAMFGAIQFDIEGACVLDAFAGSGALGIEALSRGAAHVDFVEKNKECLHVIKQNLQNIVKTSCYDVYQGDVLRLMPFLKKYDILFLDPPYDEGLYEPVLRQANTHGILNKSCKNCGRMPQKILILLFQSSIILQNERITAIFRSWFLVYGE